jgi:hypothetical protein
MSSKADDAEVLLKMRKQYTLLCEYVIGLADKFDVESKSAKNMGLFTPVGQCVQKSSSPNSV